MMKKMKSVMFVECRENYLESKSDTMLYLATFTHFTFVFEGLIVDRTYAFTSFLSFDGRKERKIRTNCLRIYIAHFR